MAVRIIFLLSALSILASTHIFALKFFLYWKYFWLDIPVHILGGVCVALGISVLSLFRIALPQRYETLSVYLGIVFLIGIFWEIFEVWAGIPVTEDGFLFDVFLDLSMDLLGGVIGYGIVKSIQKL